MNPIVSHWRAGLATFWGRQAGAPNGHGLSENLSRIGLYFARAQIEPSQTF